MSEFVALFSELIGLSLASEDINTVVLDWDMFRVGSHVDVTEFEITQIDRKACSKYLDIGTVQ